MPSRQLTSLAENISFTLTMATRPLTWLAISWPSSMKALAVGKFFSRAIPFAKMAVGTLDLNCRQHRALLIGMLCFLKRSRMRHTPTRDPLRSVSCADSNKSRLPLTTRSPATTYRSAMSKISDATYAFYYRSTRFDGLLANKLGQESL